MSGPSPDRPASRRPRGLIGMLALVLVVEARVAGLRDDLVRPLGESWRFAASAARAQAKGSDVLCFGDSLVKYGLLPKVIEARSGLRTYNLAISGGTTASAFFLLRGALESGARPRAVVVDFAALMDGGDSLATLRNYPELATAGDCLDLARVAGAPEFFGSAMVAKLLPTARYRFEIRNAVLAALGGWGLSERASVTTHRLIWARERGAQPTEPGRFRHPQEAALVDRLCPEGWTCPPGHEAYVDRFLELAGSRGVAVYWLLPPLAPGVHELRAARGSEASYERFARAVAARHPGVVVLDARGSGYDDSVHVDHLHLDRRGAAVLSADVAAALADRPEGRPSWVNLPPLAGRSGDEPTSAVARSQPAPGVAR